MAFLRRTHNEEEHAHPTEAAAQPSATAPLEAPPEADAQPWWDDASSAPSTADTAPLSPPAVSNTAPLGGEAATDDTTNLGTRELDATAIEHAPSNPPRQRKLAAAALRDVGQVRQINQDNLLAMLTTLPRESGDITLGLFVVADGMGGHDGGEIASRIAISVVTRYVLGELVVPALVEGNTEPLQAVITGAIQEANRAIWQHARSLGSDMGTTCTAALLLGHTLYIGHVGDSRLYLRQNNTLACLTNDHSAVGRLIQVGQLGPNEAREHPLRSQLYRTVGQTPEVAVDYTYHQIGDASHVLVCSDGLWGMVDEADMNAALARHEWPLDACHDLVALANQAGGDDNISAVVVTLPGA